MSKRFPTYGGTLKWDHAAKQITQIRCLNPPSYNARFRDRIRNEYPEYTLVVMEDHWKKELLEKDSSLTERQKTILAGGAKGLSEAWILGALKKWYNDKFIH